MTGETWVSKKVPHAGRIKVQKVYSLDLWIVIIPHFHDGEVRYLGHTFELWSEAFNVAITIEEVSKSEYRGLIDWRE